MVGALPARVSPGGKRWNVAYQCPSHRIKMMAFDAESAHRGRILSYTQKKMGDLRCQRGWRAIAPGRARCKSVEPHLSPCFSTRGFRRRLRAPTGRMERVLGGARALRDAGIAPRQRAPLDALCGGRVPREGAIHHAIYADRVPASGRSTPHLPRRLRSSRAPRPATWHEARRGVDPTACDRGKF